MSCATYVELLKQLEAGQGLDAPAFDLTPEERQETRHKLDGELYTMYPVRRYVLLRLDEKLANNPGVSYKHRIITVQHVLPQNPSAESQWAVDFTDAERLHWTHRLGNLLLLNRNKNSQAQNFDFTTKKEKYFSPAAGVTGFALTTLVLSESAWTPDIVEQRQKDLVEVLAEEWSL